MNYLCCLLLRILYIYWWMFLFYMFLNIYLLIFLLCTYGWEIYLKCTFNWTTWQLHAICNNQTKAYSIFISLNIHFNVCIGKFLIWCTFFLYVCKTLNIVSTLKQTLIITLLSNHILATLYFTPFFSFYNH